MTDGQTLPVVEAIERFKRQLLARDARRSAEMAQAYGRIWVELQIQIEDIAEAIEESEDRERLMRRLRSLQRQVDSEIGRYAIYADQQLAVGVQDGIESAAQDARRIVAASYPALGDEIVRALWNKLPTDALEAAVGMLSGGSALRNRMTERLGPALAQSVGDKLLVGIAEGWNPRKTQAELRRTFGQGLEWSMNATRTATMYAYREGTRANYVANDRIVRAHRWLSAKDARVCMSCVVMDGTILPLSEPINDHYGGRCTSVPYVASYRELGIDIDGPYQEPMQTTREWFESQPEEVQRQMMGATAWEEWQAGKFDLRDYSVMQEDEVYGVMRQQASLKELLGEMERAV